MSLLLAAVALLAGAGTANADSLAERISPLVEGHRGQVGVAVRHLSTGEEFTYRADVPMPTASLIKTAVMVEAYRQAHAGTLDLARMITLAEDDKVQGSGILTPHFSAGMQISVRDAIRLMMAYSDNTATNLVLDAIGLGSTAETMRAWGYPHTQIHAKVFRGDTSIAPERSREFGLGSTTALEMVRLFEQLHRQEIVSPKACEEMIEHLLRCEDRHKFRKLLPAGTKVAYKTGSVSNARTAAGLLYTPKGAVALCVLTNENRDRSWSDENAGDLLCARIAKSVYDYFETTRPKSTEEIPSELQAGMSGELVEALQRTLNVRLKPSPKLSVDGEFGEVTRAAVEAFQRSAEVEVTGIVETRTWEALGPLLTEPEPVPAPDLVNSEVLERKPADALTGPPFVTSKAWAIADGKTGEVLWGNCTDEPLDNASTTKMMTAYLVLRLAASDPKVLDEVVTFSRRADRTGGSTSGIREGEQLSVGHLLYGLMLPSGNDASVALAEHFGGRVDTKQKGGGSGDPLQAFVSAMNHAAEELGMSQSHYENPHGLTAKGHACAPRDLVRLAWAGLKIPHFAEYVQTRQHGCEVIGKGGYRRNVVWKNTNELLEIDGYLGVKTGTTSAAGACLVSAGKRGNDMLLIAVLGATSSDARYVDTRNLFRWGWQQRGHEEKAGAAAGGAGGDE